ncbi:hypothetical protein EV426DRAFT_644462 [Tirmania nivea]|nr:hypothetical protein EV426DRAFT_644462 [Tirmania nivea]
MSGGRRRRWRSRGRGHEANADAATAPAPPARQRQTARRSAPFLGQAQTHHGSHFAGLAVVCEDAPDESDQQGRDHVSVSDKGHQSARLNETAHPESGENYTRDDGDDDGDNSAARALADFTPYQQRPYLRTEETTFNYTATWDPTNLMRPGLLAIHIGPWFEARNAHLQTFTTFPTLCTSLTKVSLLNSSLLTDTGVKDLVSSCPSLKSLTLAAATKLTNASFEAAVMKLSDLEFLCITGKVDTVVPDNPSRSGKLRTEGSISCLLRRAPRVDGTTGRPYIAGKLRRLELTGHDGLSLAACKKVTRKRDGLEIKVGSVGPLHCTFWRGELVRVEVNPVYDEFADDDDESADGEELASYDDDGDDDEVMAPLEELQMSEEDLFYETFLEADHVQYAQLDEKTGRLIPANGLYWVYQSTHPAHSTPSNQTGHLSHPATAPAALYSRSDRRRHGVWFQRRLQGRASGGIALRGGLL